jgi:putative FmdB family regulatory protein
MPTYEYKCPDCSYTEDKIHGMQEELEFLCPLCKSNRKKTRLKKHFTPTIGGFIVRGGSESINWKEKRYRMKKGNELGVRQIERYGSGPRIRPNVAGVETDNWSDAAKMAKEAGMSTESYEPMIEKEKYTSKLSNVDDRAWKQAKDKI